MKSISNQVIRYSQCWEDASLLLDTLKPASGDVVISIASAGDNTLSLLSQNPERVIAVDLSPAQLYLLEYKAACFKVLSHGQTLTLLGVKGQEKLSPGLQDLRWRLYQKIRPTLTSGCASYFDSRSKLVKRGVNHGGKLESYFAIFRRLILPMVHRQETISALFANKSESEREMFYKTWANPAYRLLCKMFFSKPLLRLLGRERCFFDYASDSLSSFVATATRSHLLSSAHIDNPYLHYILTGGYEEVLPHYLRAENYQSIQSNLDKLDIVQGSLTDVLKDLPAGSVSAFNLSDVFEYLDLESVARLTAQIVRVSRCGARVAYWNMLVDRNMEDFSDGQSSRQVVLENDLPGLSTTFFYKRFIFERVMA